MADKRQNRVFKSERRDVDFPMWRKKVDASIFTEKAILIPKFAEKMWDIPSLFKGLNTKKSRDSSIEIKFDGEIFQGHITELLAKKRTDSYRIFFEDDLCGRLKNAFLMSFMRDIEFKLGHKEYSNESQRLAIEDVIPFNEFLDIEWNSAAKRMIFTAHYRQTATFPHLFQAIAKSTLLPQLEREIAGKSQKIVASEWHPKSALVSIPEVKNVIYYLIDEHHHELYVGEATSLNHRLKIHRDEIPGWTHFRYDVLPDELAPLRERLERMIIKALAYMLHSEHRKIHGKLLSSYTLKNLKIV